MFVYTPVTRLNIKKQNTAVQGKKLARLYRKKVDTSVYTEEILKRPWTHSVHLLSSLRRHILACTLTRPRTGRVLRIRTTNGPTIQDCVFFSQINTWMWKNYWKLSWHELLKIPMKKQNPTRMVTTRAETPRLAENVTFDIWTRFKTCTQCKIMDHSWKPGHKLEWGRKK